MKERKIGFRKKLNLNLGQKKKQLNLKVERIKIQYIQDFVKNYQWPLQYTKQIVFGNDRVRICAEIKLLEE